MKMQKTGGRTKKWSRDDDQGEAAGHAGLPFLLKNMHFYFDSGFPIPISRRGWRGAVAIFYYCGPHVGRSPRARAPTLTADWA